LQVLPYLEAMGRGVLDVGDSARLGHVMKLVGNYYIMSMIELVAEGMTLADKNGLQRDSVVQFLKGAFQGPITGGEEYFIVI
jgi:3-hydroxyisobutyrate dehydrogenase-like beta-hydroxyacid dehydrogenase